MKGGWGRLALVLLVLVGAVASRLVAAPDLGQVVADFAAFPGPGRVTYGEFIAYRATFMNDERDDPDARQVPPDVPGRRASDAAPIDSTCPSTPTTVVDARRVRRMGL